MIRFTWMQFRFQALVALGGLAIVAVVLGLTGPSLVHLYDTSGFTTCSAHGDCSTVANGLLSHDRLLQDLSSVLVVVSALIGLFWGAPLVAREFETGTFRLVRAQGVTRTRWIAIKLTVVGVASMAVAGLFSLMVTWWSSPLDRVNPNQLSTLFAERGIVAIGYAAFAFALGVTTGLLIRRTLPAMVTTLVGYVIVRLGVTKLRPHFQAPLTLREKLATGDHGIVQAWEIGYCRATSSVPQGKPSTKRRSPVRSSSGRGNPRRAHIRPLRLAWLAPEFTQPVCGMSSRSSPLAVTGPFNGTRRRSSSDSPSS